MLDTCAGCMHNFNLSSAASYMATPLPEPLKCKSKSQLMFMDLKTLIKNKKRPQFPADRSRSLPSGYGEH